LLAADHFTKDQMQNWSVTHGLPISWKKQWHQRSFILWALFVSVFVIGSAISYIVSIQIETPGSFMYPTAIYQNGEMQYLPMWKYLTIVFLLAMFLSYILFLLTTGLSWIFRNFYLTILIILSLSLIPKIWTIIPSFSSWQPSLYLNIADLLQGKTAM